MQVAQVSTQFLAVLCGKVAAPLGTGQGSRRGTVRLEVLLELARLQKRLLADGAQQAFGSRAFLCAGSGQL